MAGSTGDDAQRPAQGLDVGRTFEVLVRIAAGLLLVGWCLYILAPFFHAVVWGVLLAIAVLPTFRRVVAAMGGRSRTAAILFAAGSLACVLLPTVLLSASVASGAKELAAEFQAGKLRVPPPSPSVADWPVVGEKLYSTWSAASRDLGALAAPVAPYLKTAGEWTVSIAESLGSAIVQGLLAIVLAAAFLAQSEWSQKFSTSLASKVGGVRGVDFARIATVTVRGVARGILGVAIIQSALAGIGFAVIGIPGAGLWALLCLICCVVQIPAAVVVLPTIVYVFSVEPVVAASIYAVWAAFVMVSDNILKPFLFGSDVETPALVLMIGSIGGLLTSGVIGLFTGAVVLALGYELLRAWLESGAPEVVEKLVPGDADGAAAPSEVESQP